MTGFILLILNENWRPYKAESRSRAESPHAEAAAQRYHTQKIKTEKKLMVLISPDVES